MAKNGHHRQNEPARTPPPGMRTVPPSDLTAGLAAAVEPAAKRTGKIARERTKRWPSHLPGDHVIFLRVALTISRRLETVLLATPAPRLDDARFEAEMLLDAANGVRVNAPKRMDRHALAEIEDQHARIACAVGRIKKRHAARGIASVLRMLPPLRGALERMIAAETHRSRPFAAPIPHP